MFRNHIIAIAAGLVLSANSHIHAQPGIEWSLTFGGSSYDDFRDIKQTNNGTYITIGHTSSFNGNVSGQHGSGDAWLVKLNSAAQIEWQKCLGGDLQDFGNSIEQTTDGGFIFAGSTASNDGDVSGNHGLVDFWVVKLDQTGAIQWQKCLGGSSTELAWACKQTGDGGYIIGGQTYSNNGDVSGNHGNSDCWFVKLDQTGQIQWSKTAGGTADEFLNELQLCPDGGFIIAATSESNDGDLTQNRGDADAWIAKFSSSGDLVWQKSLGGSNTDGAISLNVLDDGGFIISAYTTSNDGDVIGNNGLNDNWIFKLDSTGILLWQTCIGGTLNDSPGTIIQSEDGGFVFAGKTNSFDGDVDTTFGEDDWYVVKLNALGAIEWSQSFGGSGLEYAYAIYQTIDQGLVIAGYSASVDGNIIQNQGYIDAWIVKLTDGMSINPIALNSIITLYPNPASDYLTIRSYLKTLPNESFSIYNYHGQIVRCGLISSAETTISLETLPPGLYTIFVGNNKSYPARFIKY